MRANTPTWSRVSAKGSAPWMGKLSKLGLKPTTPQNAAGRITEPLVCVPTATGTWPAATAAADPEEEPPGVCLGFQGLRVAAGGEDSCDELGVFSGLIADERGRAHFRGQVIGVVDVLHPDRDTVQRVPALCALGVAGGGDGERALVVERNPRSHPAFARVDAGEAGLAVGASGQGPVGEPLNGPLQVLARGRLRGWVPLRHAAMARPAGAASARLPGSADWADACPTALPPGSCPRAWPSPCASRAWRFRCAEPERRCPPPGTPD